MSGFRPVALIVATMETEHYTFNSCGATVTSAKQYMLETWLSHLRQLDMPTEDPRFTIAGLEDMYGINIMRVFPGGGWRDGEQVWTKDR